MLHLIGKSKDKGRKHLISSLYEASLSLKRSGMARVVKGSLSFTCVYPQMELDTPAFVFPPEVGLHLPIPEGWKVELA